MWFHAISDRLAKLLGGTPYVVGAMAWLHDRAVLRAINTKTNNTGAAPKHFVGAPSQYHNDAAAASGGCVTW